MTMYDRIATTYTSETDHPCRMHMAYPTWLKACGQLSGLRVLDLGCGSGRSTRLLRDSGALVVNGLDVSSEMLKLARLAERGQVNPITYFLADARKIPARVPIYDLITPTYILPYATTLEDLRGMVRSMSEHTCAGGRVVGLSLHPDQPEQKFEPGLGYSTEFIGTPFKDGSELGIVWYNSADMLTCEAVIYYWSRETYEIVLAEAGFNDVKWIPLETTKQGKVLIKNWQRLQKNNNACVISARRR